MKNEFVRNRKLIAMILCVALAFTMNGVSLAAAEAVDGSLSIACDPAEDDFALNSFTTEINSGEWTASVEKEDNAKIQLTSSSNPAAGVDAEIVLLNGENYIEEKKDSFFGITGYYQHCYKSDVTANLSGNTDSRDLVIHMSENQALRSSSPSDNNVKLNNSLTIRVGKGKASASGVVVKVETLKRKKISDNSYSYQGIDSYSYQGIDYSTIKIITEPGVRYSVDRESSADFNILTFETDDIGISMNKPGISANRKVGNYSVIYNTWIPSFGKKIKKDYLDNVLGSIKVYDENGYEYTVKKAKVVRLNTSPKDQGPFPSVVNAGIQIIKLGVKSNKAGKKVQKGKADKKVQKEIKRATKTKKSFSPDNVALPVIIYPFRLTSENLIRRDSKGQIRKDNKGNIKTKKVTVKGKAGKYKIQFSAFDNKIKYANGKKDLFKNGVHNINFDKSTKILSVNSADAWTGPDGLAETYINDKTK